jgi:hypothetical protein
LIDSEQACSAIWAAPWLRNQNALDNRIDWNIKGGACSVGPLGRTLNQTTSAGVEFNTVMLAQGWSRGSVAMPLFDRHAIQSIVAEGGGVSEAIAPGLRNLFDDVTSQPVPAFLAALIGRLDTLPGEGIKEGNKEEGEHGPGKTQAADRFGRGG